eukprot:CAMPEP_0168556910 /NCGR_PEP_ID=MMETSP0413-20121227/9138_1 /TAXON_ID=136452 /ORGANISM="Filamoeba nolandi, Strain NC-AS-23-1" /LENGTH=132 /DNA_ID=CAMNT_0008587895 /DNA_START=38 /DNA_END=436 /DNA_ORIENTATION=+
MKNKLEEILEGAGMASKGREHLMKIYLTNDSYKTVLIKNDMKVSDLAVVMAQKLNIDHSYAIHLDLFEFQNDSLRKLNTTETILGVVLNWPVTFGKTGNETHLHCKLMCKPNRYAPQDVLFQYWTVTSLHRI